MSQDGEVEQALASQASQGLTYRQVEIIRLIVQGLSNKEIGRQLNISEGTVKIHLHKIYMRLGLRNRTSLIAFAFRKIRSNDCP
jgi:two-component system, NarL family, nitrate/nitrite response regulator NarL